MYNKEVNYEFSYDPGRYLLKEQLFLGEQNNGKFKIP